MRIIVARHDTPEQAVAYFESRAYKDQNDIERYGRAIAYQRAGHQHVVDRRIEKRFSMGTKSSSC